MYVILASSFVDLVGKVEAIQGFDSISSGKARSLGQEPPLMPLDTEEGEQDDCFLKESNRSSIWKDTDKGRDLVCSVKHEWTTDEDA
jgi:hypothetical protein